MEKQRRFLVTLTPHIRAKDNISDIMMDVLLALAPAAFMGAYHYGYRAVIIMAVAIASSVLFELLFQIVVKRPVTLSDFSAVVTGLLLAFNLPASAPVWVPIVGSFFAIVIVKQLFGGLGQNFMNPALGARAFLLASYPAIMTDWSAAPVTADAVSAATPLSALKTGFIPASSDLWNAFAGNIGGCIGETCAAALLLGGVYLLIRRVISWRIPAAYIGTFCLMAWIIGRDGAFSGYPLYEVMVGGVMLGALFMATDYSTSPYTEFGQIVFGIGCGALTAVIRILGSYPEGTTYAILFMNLTVPLIDKITKPRIYGEVRKNVGRG